MFCLQFAIKECTEVNICKTIIMLVFIKGCETLSTKLTVFENRVLRRVHEPERNWTARDCTVGSFMISTAD